MTQNMKQETQEHLSKLESLTVGTLLGSGLEFREHYVNLREMVARPTDQYKEQYGAGSRKNLLSTAIEFGGRTFFPSDRFWTSFCAKVGVGTNIFNLFNHEEVFNRCVQKNMVSDSGNVRIMEDVRSNRLLAVSDPAKPIPNWKNVMQLVDKKDGIGVVYNDGVITSIHSMPNAVPMLIGSEDYKQRFAVQIPVDAYGSPSVYLALLRQVCTNQIIAMGKCFKTQVKMGKKGKRGFEDDVEFTLERMFDSFSNDEGFDALVKRMDAARKSKLSVREFNEVQETLCKLKHSQDDLEVTLQARPEVRVFNALAGDLHTKYGLAHLKEMTDRQMGLLETNLTVYEAFNYISEVTSHRINYANPQEAAVAAELHAWAGRAMSSPFDLEGTVPTEDVKSEFKDRYLAHYPNTN